MASIPPFAWIERIETSLCDLKEKWVWESLGGKEGGPILGAPPKFLFRSAWCKITENMSACGSLDGRYDDDISIDQIE